eukprot:gene9733-11368_t
MDYIVETIGLDSLSNAYISGYSNDSVQWYYQDTIIEHQTLLYDHSDDRSTFPAFPNEAFIRNVEDQPLHYLCEYESMPESLYDLYIPSQDYDGRSITIFHNDYFDIKNMTVVLVDLVTNLHFYITYLEKGEGYSKWGPESKDLYMPLSRYDVIFESSENETFTVYYETKPYHIDFVDFKDLASGTISITGTSIATMMDNSKINISFGDVNCELDNYVLNMNDILCVLDTNSIVTLLPFSITANGITRTTYKYKFATPNSQSKRMSFYRLLFDRITFNDALQYASRFNMMGLIGHMQGVYSEDFADIVEKMTQDSTPTKFGLPSSTKFWMNFDSTVTKQFKVITGPLKDEIRKPYYTGVIPPIVDQDLESYVLNVPSFTLTTLFDTGLAGMIIEIGGYVVYNMLPINNYQKLYLNQVFYPTRYVYGDLNSLNVDLSHSNEDGTISMRIYQMTEDGFELSSSTTAASFVKPILKSVIPASAPFEGGLLRIYVSNTPSYGFLSVNLFKNLLDVDHYSLVQILQDNGFNTVDFYVPPFYQMEWFQNSPREGYQLSVRSRGYETDSIHIPINGIPAIESITSLAHGTPGDVTITGSNLCIPNAKVTIDDTLCQLSEPVSANCTRYVCHWNAEPLQIDPFTVKFEIESFSTWADIFYYNNDIACPANCSDNGICDKTIGICTCFSGFASYNCSLAVMAPINQPITNSNLKTSFEDNSAKFIFQLHSMVYGHDFMDPVHVDLANGGWKKVDSQYSSAEQMFGVQRLTIDPYSLNFEVFLQPVMDLYKTQFPPYHLLFAMESTKANTSFDQSCQIPPAYDYHNVGDRLQFNEINKNGSADTY